MKKLEITIRPENLEEIKQILSAHGVTGMTIFSAMGAGNQKGEKDVVRFNDKKIHINLLPKIHVVAYVKDTSINEILINIHEQLATGQVGDGKVAVSPVEEIMRIRTGERGEDAL
ncbi:nitrogen regulatory protein PII [Liquorilactobacillus ghanensis DSM 18630]|jgi:nitrogen regulatory protein P-II 1|uniref:Nitrogen regulatory protein PII n=1 Tax=Liquorilactobacillus ghanensis DSM 18630 TaxID=1423750 RepID=A0A0R1VTR9_9LACO|nr:P-II family nitrogen regulator [Liquorilactobacillus ghanensis]KRM06086.1 nitrogen regulatory protein PII [Liquorilactobacillus ghanensis DSM 18630]